MAELSEGERARLLDHIDYDVVDFEGMVVTFEALLAARLAPIEALHRCRPHTSNGGLGFGGMLDFVGHGQTEFPDQCDHCRSAWPCPTARALAAPRPVHPAGDEGRQG